MELSCSSMCAPKLSIGVPRAQLLTVLFVEGFVPKIIGDPKSFKGLPASHCLHFQLAVLTGVLIQETRLSFDLKALEEKACAFCKLDYAGTHLLPTACMREPSTFAGLAGQRVRAGLESFALLPSEIHLSTTAILREPSDMQDLREVSGALL